MRGSKFKATICRLFLAGICFFVLSPLAYAEILTSFLPIHTNHAFYLLQAHQTNFITIEKWDESPEMTTLQDFLLAYRRGYLNTPTQKIFLTRTKIDDELQTVTLHTQRPEPESHSSRFSSVYEREEDLYLTHTQGIDRISKQYLFQTLKRQTEEFMIDEFQPHQHATSTVFLEGRFQNDLQFISTWDPVSQTSTILLQTSLDQKINEWTVNVPLLNLTLVEGNAGPLLFASSGERGITIFQINLEESTIHPNFLKKIEMIDPLPGDIYGGLWIQDKDLYYTKNYNQTSSLHMENFESLVHHARILRQEKIAQAMNFPFTMEQTSKSFLNGLFASFPLDADRLVDLIGFDLKGNLEAQLESYDVLDSITDEERQDLESLFQKVKFGGEMLGYTAMTLATFTKISQIRKLKKEKLIKNIASLNDIRFGLGISQGGTLSAATGKNWLKAWRASELAISDDAAYVTRLGQLRKLKAGQEIFLPEQLDAMMKSMQARQIYLRPFERVLHQMNLASPQISRLERWTFERMHKFFNGTNPLKLQGWIPFQGLHVDDLSKLFSQTTLNMWQRLERLHRIENISDFQRAEYFYLQMRVKAGLLQALNTARTQGEALKLAPKTVKALGWLERKAGITSTQELSITLRQAEHLTQVLDASEEAYVLSRLLHLEKLGDKLTDLEKLEKLKLMLKAGWTGNTGSRLIVRAWDQTELLNRRGQILQTLDHIYDYEQIKKSGYLSRCFKNGKLKEMLFFTFLSDAMNVGTEYIARTLDGRPFLSPGLAHNLAFNTYVMIPIFASRGLRLSPQGKLFLILFNAASAGYFSQKLTKWAGASFNSQTMIEKYNSKTEKFNYFTDLLPPPKMPPLEIPGFIFRDALIHPDPAFNLGRAAFDSGWVILLSTPRGHLCSYAANEWAMLPRYDVAGLTAAAQRLGAYSAPIILNEGMGAYTYPPIYGSIFEDMGFQLNIIDAKLQFIHPWESKDWDSKPKLKLSLFINSSSPINHISFDLRSETETIHIKMDEPHLEETVEQHYIFTWEKEMDYPTHPLLYRIENLALSNQDRFVGNALEFWKEKELDPGHSLNIEKPFEVLVARDLTFEEGFFQALLKIAKEAQTQFYKNNKPHFAAGMVYMIGHFLDRLLEHGKILPGQSHNLAMDALKESIKIAKTVNFADHPIQGPHLDLLIEYLEELTHQMIPNEHVGFHELSTRTQQMQFINQAALDRLKLMEADIRIETETCWGGLCDQGSKNDWHTLQLYKGYSYALSKLYHWYRNHFFEEYDPKGYALEEIANILDEMKNFKSELETSWIQAWTWSDKDLKEFADKFSLLRKELEEASE